jgi:hypothetical protein
MVFLEFVRYSPRNHYSTTAHGVCDSPDQVTYYHILGPEVGGFISEEGLEKEKVNAEPVEEFQQMTRLEPESRL